MSYYGRQASDNSDGTPLFTTDTDVRNERDVLKKLELAWKCKIHPFGKLCPVDYYALRDNRMAGVIELKSRTHNQSNYPTVFLNVRKWLALVLASVGLGCPAIFVVKFTDGIYYIAISDVPTGAVTIGGTKKRVKSHSDIEPVFEVPVGLLKRLHREERQNVTPRF